MVKASGLCNTVDRKRAALEGVHDPVAVRGRYRPGLDRGFMGRFRIGLASRGKYEAKLAHRASIPAKKNRPVLGIWPTSWRGSSGRRTSPRQGGSSPRRADLPGEVVLQGRERVVSRVGRDPEREVPERLQRDAGLAGYCPALGQAALPEQEPYRFNGIRSHGVEDSTNGNESQAANRA